jgi:hypothetical protein
MPDGGAPCGATGTNQQVEPCSDVRESLPSDAVTPQSGDRSSAPQGVPPDGPLNPGSPAAHARGCRCPSIDNNHGKTAPWPPDGWWVNEGCPMHSLPGQHRENVLGRLDSD